jgi:NAD(P)H-hydrate epimerase
VEDAQESRVLPGSPRFLVLVGKGHNGGDALIAARTLLELRPDSATRVEVVFVFGERSLRPLAARAWRDLAQHGGTRVRVVPATAMAGRYDVVLDGIFGFNFRAPADPAVARVIAAANALEVGLRAAVDVPSAGLFQADFTYATGSVKAPVVGAPAAGRVRYLDLGFFAGAFSLVASAWCCPRCWHRWRGCARRSRTNALTAISWCWAALRIIRAQC